MVRNARTFERLKKTIMKGKYDKEELVLDMTDFLELGTLTESEFSALLELIEQYPPANSEARTIAEINEDGIIISDNTFLLLEKQIIKQVYSAETIEQMTTDFKITKAITREQFKILINLIEEIYHPVINEEENFTE